jgi:hypothetical protein
MHKAFAAQALVHARARQKIDSARFKDPGADSRFHIGAITLLQKYAAHPRHMQELRQEKPGRPGPNDGDLRAQALLPNIRRSIGQF